jgi:hypothetical protein
MYIRSVVLLLLLLALFACASGPRFSGQSVADSRLRADTTVFIIGPTLAATNCKQVDSIQTSIISVDKDLQGNAAGKIVKGDTSERWVASACGKTVSFLVTYHPDGQGGSFLAVHQEK